MAASYLGVTPDVEACCNGLLAEVDVFTHFYVTGDEEISPVRPLQLFKDSILDEDYPETARGYLERIPRQVINIHWYASVLS